MNGLSEVTLPLLSSSMMTSWKMIQGDVAIHFTNVTESTDF